MNSEITALCNVSVLYVCKCNSELSYLILKICRIQSEWREVISVTIDRFTKPDKKKNKIKQGALWRVIARFSTVHSS